MRTMLRLDDDIADYLKERGWVHNKLFERVVNETLRQAMEAGKATEADADGKSAEKQEPSKVIPFSSEYAPRVAP